MKNPSRGHYDITFTKLADDASTMTPDELIRNYFSLLEKDIQEEPFNWLWTHKRWK